MWDNWYVKIFGCRIFRIQDVWENGCSVRGMFEMWDIWDVELLDVKSWECGMLGMRYVRDAQF